MSPVLMDPELGYTAFTVQRTTYRCQNGEPVSSVQTMTGAGDIHPGTPEMVQFLPEEDRHEEFISIYTDFTLSTGENNGGAQGGLDSSGADAGRITGVYCDHGECENVNDETGSNQRWRHRRLRPGNFAGTGKFGNGRTFFCFTGTVPVFYST